jgi:cytochrome c oxidase assembly protein subunit 15
MTGLILRSHDRVPMASPRDATGRPGLARLCRHLVVALIALVTIGGATRVMEAGLACPDWPLCFGALLPAGQMSLRVFLEWFHRLDAALVSAGLLLLVARSWWTRRQGPAWLPWVASLALLLVLVQAGLGALTVTRLLRFDIVSAHLVTGLTLVALLSGLAEALSPPNPGMGGDAALPRGLAALSLALLMAQCLAGGLMATQWATGFCLHQGQACSWLQLHRLLAAPAALLGLATAASVLRRGTAGRGRLLALLLAAGCLLQPLLGWLTLRLALGQPLVTVAHQCSAALLVAVLAALVVSLRPIPSEVSSRG